MNRYKVVQLTTGKAPYFKWAILDKEWWDYCTLPNQEDPSSPIPLEWGSKEGAEYWLKTCFRVWGQWESAKAPVPEGWKPLPPDPVNPFDRFAYDR